MNQHIEAAAMAIARMTHPLGNTDLIKYMDYLPHAKAALDAALGDTHVIVPRDPTEVMVDKGLASTAVWHEIKGSQLTVNIEKMRIRYRAMIAAYTSNEGG